MFGSDRMTTVLNCQILKNHNNIYPSPNLLQKIDIARSILLHFQLLGKLLNLPIFLIKAFPTCRPFTSEVQIRVLLTVYYDISAMHCTIEDNFQF